jgi:hypothetical protein
MQCFGYAFTWCRSGSSLYGESWSWLTYKCGAGHKKMAKFLSMTNKCYFLTNAVLIQYQSFRISEKNHTVLIYVVHFCFGKFLRGKIIEIEDDILRILLCWPLLSSETEAWISVYKDNLTRLWRASDGYLVEIWNVYDLASSWFLI